MLKTSKAARLFACAAFSLVSALASGTARAEDTIKVGILHSLSGTMAISETTLKDVMLMLIDEQNKKGGLLGKKLEAVVVDPASNWPLFAEKARQLISQDKVAATFGCWTSVCSEPAGYSCRRLPYERRQDRALGAGRNRLRLSAHDQQDP
jgi:urea transport system substrate-binding protein